MSDYGAATHNTAQSGSNIVIQGRDVHDNKIYYYAQDDPKEKYAVGVRYLNNGVPSQARALIADAISRGYDTTEARFRWMLAILSQRSFRDLTAEDHDTLRHAAQVRSPALTETVWADALTAICEILDGYKRRPEQGTGAVVKRLQDLPEELRREITRHLDLIITGRDKDLLWAETRKTARDNQFSNDRSKRMWAYFHPKPAPPRAREPEADSTTGKDRFLAYCWSALFLLATGNLGWSLLVNPAPIPIVAYLLAIAAGVIAARTGPQWYYRAQRLKTKDRDYFRLPAPNRAPAGGFASQVDHSFNHYAVKYGPEGEDLAQWLADTAGIRHTRRNEIVHIYREKRLRIDQINWLIQHLVADIAAQWRHGTLLAYRDRLRTPLSTKVWCTLALAALAPTAAEVVTAALHTNALSGASTTLIAVITGTLATRRWLHISSERRRAAADQLDHEDTMHDRLAAYQRWKAKLDKTRPAEHEMETWLNCDTTTFLDQVLRHYRLAWRDIIAYAMLKTPAPNRKRARESGGPWRYSKYNLRLFLITCNGVREASTELDFEHDATCNGQDRDDYRFDAVSSVHVTETNDHSYALALTLTNGPTRKIDITETKTDNADPDENGTDFAEMNLDAAGFRHALHILEGIAAEGKTWINGISDPRNNHAPPTTNNV